MRDHSTIRPEIMYLNRFDTLGVYLSIGISKQVVYEDDVNVFSLGVRDVNFFRTSV